jgi:hypothetical protein
LFANNSCIHNGSPIEDATGFCLIQIVMLLANNDAELGDPYVTKQYLCSDEH